VIIPAFVPAKKLILSCGLLLSERDEQSQPLALTPRSCHYTWLPKMYKNPRDFGVY